MSQPFAALIAVTIVADAGLASALVRFIADGGRVHRELVRDSGFVFKAGDTEDLVRALEAALLLSPEALEHRKRSIGADLAAWRDPLLSAPVADILR